MKITSTRFRRQFENLIQIKTTIKIQFDIQPKVVVAKYNINSFREYQIPKFIPSRVSDS